MHNPGQISVIIPALNEAEHIRATLLSLQTDPDIGNHRRRRRQPRCHPGAWPRLRVSPS